MQASVKELDVQIERQTDRHEKGGLQRTHSAAGWLYEDRRGCRGSSKVKCTRLYFVCFSVCLSGLDYYGQRLGSTTYGGCLSVFVGAFRGRVSTVEKSGLA